MWQIALRSAGHKAICSDFNYEGLWERGAPGSTMNHCHSASLPLDKNVAHAGCLFVLNASWLNAYCGGLCCDASGMETLKMESRPTEGRLIKNCNITSGVGRRELLHEQLGLLAADGFFL